MWRLSRRDLLELGLLASVGITIVALRRRPAPAPADEQPAEQAIPAAAWTRAIGEPATDVGHAVSAQQVDDGAFQGLPLGGLGSGSIGRTYRGDFARWHLDVGRHHFEPLLANQFSVRVEDGPAVTSTVLCSARPTDRLGAWHWSYPAGRGRYHALFPRAWFVYDPAVVGCELSMLQFSPVLPGNYRESSYPVAVFAATARNPTDHPVQVSLMLTWQNLVGWDNGVWRRGGQINRPQVETLAADDQTAGRVVGVVLDSDRSVPQEPSDGQFAIATRSGAGVSASYRARFRADDDGADVWADFEADGHLDDVADDRPAALGEELAAAVCASFVLQAGEARTVTFALAWDLPIMRFGPPDGGRRWLRRYTRFFGSDGRHAWDMAHTALEQAEVWQAAIAAWQAPILADPATPPWYPAALFNELYYLVDGGTAWENGELAVAPPAAGQPAAPPPGVGRFALLECFDYPFYSTLDVRFYSSWALAMLWPELELQEVRQFAHTVALDDPRPVTIESSGQPAVRKRAGALPHDLGAPADDPWIQPNSYSWQDINIWKDLNAKFVLQVYRDYVLIGDRSLIDDCWPAVTASLAYLKQWDRDGDGLPENDGVPDQTYDTWPMTGPSAYCGGLWLAALRAAEAMGGLVGDTAAVTTYASWRASAERAYEALWNGAYYQFDQSQAGHADTLMADQLCGQWYAQATGLPPIVPSERIRQVLRLVYERNVLGFGGGRLGAVNGTRPDGSVDLTCDQSQEVWSGVSYALAAFMLDNELPTEAWQTAWGVYDVTYHARGFWFRTPEAWTVRGEFRASMYLRPLAIWAMQHALERTRRSQTDPPPASFATSVGGSIRSTFRRPLAWTRRRATDQARVAE